jgi:hypothetical protein
VFWGVVDREPAPQPATVLFAEPVRRRLAGVSREVGEYQVDGFGGGITGCDVEQKLGEVGIRSVRRHLGEVASGLRFHGAEHVRRSASFVLVVATSGVAGADRRGRPRAGVQDKRLFIQANHRSQRLQRGFVYLQHIFHALDISLIELGDAPHFFLATA